MAPAAISGKLFRAVLVLLIPALAVSAGAVGSASTDDADILITDVSPSPGNVLEAGSTVTFNLTIDTVGIDGVRYVTVSVNEHEWGEIDREITFTEDDEPYRISISETINESWEIATLSVSLYAENRSPRVAHDTDKVTYGVGDTEKENLPPSAVMKCSNTEIAVDEPLYCSAENSTDPDGEIVFYKWTIGAFETEFGASFEYLVPEVEGFLVALVVRDNDGAIDRTTRWIDVRTETTTARSAATPRGGSPTEANGTAEGNQPPPSRGPSLVVLSVVVGVLALVLGLLDMSVGFKRITRAIEIGRKSWIKAAGLGQHVGNRTKAHLISLMARLRQAVETRFSE